MFKKFCNNKIFFPLVALAIALIITISVVYAWFVISKETNTDYMIMGVVNLDTNNTAIEVTVIGGGSGSVNKIIPNESISISYSVTNDSDALISYELYLYEYIQSYPQTNLAVPLLDKDVYEILIDESEVLVDLDYEESLQQGFKNNFYCSFRSTISNALAYRLYELGGTAPNEYNAMSTKISGNTIVNSSLSNFSVPANTTKEYCFEIWFNPSYYPVCTIDGVIYIIKNSNAFIGQNFQISLGVREN